MEQLIEIFEGDQTTDSSQVQDHWYGNAFIKAKKHAEKIWDQGWFIHDMVAHDFMGKTGIPRCSLMVVYRRNADSMQSAKRFREAELRTKQEQSNAERIKQAEQKLEHAEELDEFFDDESNFS